MKLVTVLGIHHSGTTCLAEVLKRSGVRFADPLRAGTNEDQRVLMFHQRLLYWRKPILVRDRCLNEMNLLITEYQLEGVTGFKEPATLFTLPVWRRVMAEKPNCALSLVGTFRHPALVMDHFRAQFRGSNEEWDGLWCAYMQRMLDEHDAAPFPLVCFDDGPEAYSRSIDKALSELGLTPTQPPLFDLSKRRRSWPTAALYTPGLQHSAPSKRALEIYEELRSRL